MKKRATHTIEESTLAKLEKAKEETKRSKSSIVQEAIQDWILKHEKK